MEDLLPDPADLIGGLEYISQEARLRHFEKPADVNVFRYLWVNAWHNSKHKGRPVPLGRVLESKAREEDIAAEMMLGTATVGRALARLASGGWIVKEQQRFVSDVGPGWKHTNEIYVLMTPADHRERARKRDVSLGFAELLADSEQVATILDGSW